jgi:hypothetical protein
LTEHTLLLLLLLLLRLMLFLLLLLLLLLLPVYCGMGPVAHATHSARGCCVIGTTQHTRVTAPPH